MYATATPPTRHDAVRDVLTEHGSAVEVRYLDDGEVTLRILTPQEDLDTGDGAVLLARAVSQARHQRMRVVRTALDVSTPTAVEVLDALRSRVGDDIDEIALRRAGSSVMVTLRLLPLPATRRPGQPHPGRDVRSATSRPRRPSGRRVQHTAEASR
jgi:hypothetical protein